MKIDLESLIGNHLLSGAFFDAVHEGVERQVLRFTLDGQHYEAVEDPDDGYRSGLEEVRTTSIAPENQFPPVPVVGKMKEGENYVLQFSNPNTDRLVLEIGTCNEDDYYPNFVAYFSPENLVFKP